MKQSDVISVVMVAIIGSIMAFFLVNLILGEPKDVKYRSVSSVSSELANPDPEVFNYGAVNPTVEVYVGSCEDIDRDGILSDKELEACKNEGEEEPTPAPTPEPTPAPEE